MARILIAEDGRTAQLIVAAMLKQLGHTVMTANNGREAIAEAERQVPDVILMDMEMPIVNGRAATAYLRKQPLLAHIPVIALSAHTDGDEIEQALAAGCVGYLVKPVNRDSLAAKLRPYVDDASDVAHTTTQG